MSTKLFVLIRPNVLLTYTMYPTDVKSTITELAKIFVLLHGFHVTFSDRNVIQDSANDLNTTNIIFKLHDEKSRQEAVLSTNGLETEHDTKKNLQMEYEDYRTLEKLETIERKLKAHEDELKAQERTIGEAQKEVNSKKRKIMEKELSLNAWKKELRTWELRWENHFQEETEESQFQKQRLSARKQAIKERQKKLQARTQTLESLIQKLQNRQNELAADMRKLEAEMLETHKKFGAAIHQAVKNVCDGGKNLILLRNTLNSSCQSCQSYRDSHVQSLDDKTIEDVMRDDKVYHTEYVYDYEKGVSVKSGYSLDLNDPNPRCIQFKPETIPIKLQQDAAVVSDSFV